VKAKEIRRRSASDLHEEIKRLEIAAFDSRFKGQTEEKSDRGLLRRTRRDVARIRTILREREIGEAAAPGAVVAKSAAQKAVVAKAVPSKAAGPKAAVSSAPAKAGGKKKKE
jgi:large subunit ribosomal protein L29